MHQLIQFVCNDTTWALLTAGMLYLAGAWLRPLVAKLPTTNVVFRTVRLVHLVLNKVDPEGNASTKVIGVLCLAFVGISQNACTASFEEARLSGAKTTSATATRDDATCQAIDRRHRIWGGIEYGALAVTGASGLSTIPVENDTGRTALAISAVVFAATAAVSKFENDEASRSWAEQCTGK